MVNKIRFYLDQIREILLIAEQAKHEAINAKHEAINAKLEATNARLEATRAKFEAAGAKNHVVALREFFQNDLKSSKVNIGQIQSQLNNQREFINDLSEVEFQVFSQWGDDGIIQFLISKIDFPNKTFIEFGVENYIESNTRFLLLNDNWTGYVIDGSSKNIDYIKSDIISWACELYAEVAFINAENINELLKKSNFDLEIGILSIDIDGNDYWIWKAINIINPIIVIIEYNSVFGKNTTWTVPYDPGFVREEKHSSILYFGASLKSLVILAEQKGYAFIG